MKTVILQPSYIPWRGFFDQIARSDLFVFYDDVQYDKRGWRNRNKIKTSDGPQWLTIPVHSRGAQTEHILIRDVRISYDTQHPWNQEHWKRLQHAYARAPYFKAVMDLLEPFYQQQPEYLADFTVELTIAISRWMGITHTQFLRSSELGAQGAKTDRLIDVLKKVGATEYISGPSAQDYIETEKFAEAGIGLEYMEYNYPEYGQFFPPYDPYVSIVDLLMMTGERSLDYILGGQG